MVALGYDYGYEYGEAGAAAETYHILDESGNIIAAEDGSEVTTEDAP